MAKAAFIFRKTFAIARPPISRYFVKSVVDFSIPLFVSIIRKVFCTLY